MSQPVFVAIGRFDGEKYIYRCPLDKLERLANILGQHADDGNHPMTWRVADRIVDEARIVRSMAGMDSQIGESTC